MKKLIYVSFVLLLFAGNIYSSDNKITETKKTLIAPLAKSYKWYLNGEELQGIRNREIQKMQSGIYKVELVMSDESISVLKVAVSASSSARTIFVIGDSTASFYSPDRYPRTGWAQVFQPFFNSDSISVSDKALSGRSSKSFYFDPGGWRVVLPAIKKGDFLFIQFAHNDEKSDTTLHTDPSTTFKQYLSIYIDSAKSRGAYPVLLTPIHRNNWSGDLISDSHGDYPPAMRELATEKNVPLIDLHLKTKARWEELGKDFVTNNIYMNLPVDVYPNYLTGNSDNTHLQEEGAYEVCNMVINGINELKDDPAIKILEKEIKSAGFIKVLPDPALSSTFTGAGVITEGSSVIIKATPKTGYAVAEWKEGDITISTDREYSFIADSGKRYLTAVLGEGFTVSVTKNLYSGGIIGGTGSYVQGATVTLTATARSGYRFVNWTKDDVEVGTDTAYTFTMGNSDESYVANFETYTAVKSLEINKDISIYQDNSDNNLYIESKTELSKVDFIDLTGKTVHSEIINNKSAIISVSDQIAGLLVIKLTYKNDGVSVKKIFINR